jgi:IS5 family transposase
VARAVKVPVVASGGAGSAEHVVAALRSGEADAALVAGILHDGVTTVAELKAAMGDAGIAVRMVTPADVKMDPRFRGDDGRVVIPAKAGIHFSDSSRSNS